MTRRLAVFCLCFGILASLHGEATPNPKRKKKRKAPAAAAKKADTAPLKPSLAPAAAEEPATPPAAAFSASTAPAPEPAVFPSREAYRLLEEDLGRPVLHILESRGYLVLHDRSSKGPALLAARWDALGRLVPDAAVLVAASEAAERFQRGEDISASSAALDAAASAPASGVATGPVRAAAALLSEAVAQRAALGAKAGANEPKPLYRTSWGSRFAERTHADLVEDHRALAQPYFDEFLSGPWRSPEAVKHFLESSKEAFAVDLSGPLEADAAAGKLSEELKASIAKYLSRQRRRQRLDDIAEWLKTLDSRSEVKNDWRDLRLACEAIVRAPRAFERSRAAFEAEGSPPDAVGVTVTSAHLGERADGSPHERGDEVLVSAAYWVDGLPEGRSATFQETGYGERAGVPYAGVKTVTNNRRNGGPYAVSWKTVLDDSSPLTAWLVVSGPGFKPVARSLTVAPSPDFDKTLAELARAHSALAACRLKEAADDYAAFRKRLDSKPAKAQYRALAAAAKDGAARAQAALEIYAKLEDALPAARAAAGPDACAYDETRADNAWSALNRLPAGCGLAVSGELASLRAAARRHRLDQEVFDSAMSAARSEEKACRFPRAAELYADALAVLEGDPAARCGRWEAAYGPIRALDLPRALAQARLHDDFAKSLAEIRRGVKGNEPKTTLAAVVPLVARINSLTTASCYKDIRRQAEEIATVAGLSLAPPKPEALTARLPDDSTKEAVAEVLDERRKIQADADAAAKRESAEQAPPKPPKKAAAGPSGPTPAGTTKAVEPATPAKPTAPARDMRAGTAEAEKAAAKPAPKKKTKKRRSRRPSRP